MAESSTFVKRLHDSSSSKTPGKVPKKKKKKLPRQQTCSPSTPSPPPFPPLKGRTKISIRQHLLDERSKPVLLMLAPPNSKIISRHHFSEQPIDGMSMFNHGNKLFALLVILQRRSLFGKYFLNQACCTRGVQTRGGGRRGGALLKEKRRETCIFYERFRL